ncbi:unnamed protein product [Parascedosporium putredinis]|uniref:UDENN domain-containing protein n=1 Tax=Parascedosporium putredinis TaxID=1442378 RepID=A0A9P1M5Y6_9PEZI|nr:unnamed protein product [Parascedosporium putredinis]CAI7987805.1 unnamed protein product [Parascedosporium putredinis]
MNDPNPDTPSTEPADATGLSHRSTPDAGPSPSPQAADVSSLSVPPTPSWPEPLTPSRVGFIPLVTVVDFHHARGPEVEAWFGAAEGSDPAVDYNWPLLPFMALSDGAHASEEDFSYFTLLRPESPAGPATSLFGIACTRQLDSSQLINRPADVTRSTVQKAVVIIADSPQAFGMLRERLSIVTKAWFAQREFTDVEILKGFQESLADEKRRGLMKAEEENNDHNLGMSLRELVHEFKWQSLVLLKACLLQRKDCADPELNEYEKNLTPPTSLRTSDRASLLQYMGLPLQIFGKGSLFGPYTPLQQLDILADFGTKSYIVGSTNSLLLQQKDRYSDILINLDESTINISSPSLRSALALTASDRRWIDYLTQEVNETWDEANPSRPTTLRYVGSEEFIRLQFEEYILALIASVKYHNYIKKSPDDFRVLLPHIEGDPAIDFGTEGLTIDDVQRRIAEQVKELHLDERFAQGREALERNLAFGRDKASTMFNKIYADMEAFRETQRKKAEEAKTLQGNERMTGAGQQGAFTGVDLTKAQATMQSVGSKAGAYVSSWATWAGEKRKTGWGKQGWGLGGGGSKGKTPDEDNGLLGSPVVEEKGYQMLGSRNGAGSRLSGSSTASEDNYNDRGDLDRRAPNGNGGMSVTQEGFVAVETPGSLAKRPAGAPVQIKDDANSDKL